MYGGVKLVERVVDYVVQLLADDERVPSLASTGPGSAAAAYVLAAKMLSRGEQGRSTGDAPEFVDARDLVETWTDLRLDGVTLQRAVFNDVDFARSSFIGSTFRKCRFVNCDFSRAMVAQARFENCLATEDVLNHLRGQGVAELPRALAVAAAPGVVVRTEAEEFGALVLQSFFKRFIRGERGRHRRSAKRSAFVRGLNPRAAQFTRDHLLPLLLQNGVISEPPGLPVYVFNGEYQNLGDAVLRDEAIPVEFKGLHDLVIDCAGRYIS